MQPKIERVVGRGRKMRLIDVDKLPVTCNVAIVNGKVELNGWIAAERIDEAPTVEAIPIEFIKQLIEKFDCERGNAIKDTFAHILTGLLEFWEFEQEKENEAN